MIVVDTSVWIDHFRVQEPELVKCLSLGQVAVHPFVLGELIMGNLKPLDRVVALLASMPRIEPVSEAKLYDCVIGHQLSGTGLGFVDAHLIAALLQYKSLTFWTRDKRLAAQAAHLGVACMSN